MDTGTRYAVLLKGGHVMDPANNIDGIMDVAIADGKVACVQADIPAASADSVIDVKGHYVTPGIVDIHAHAFPLHPLPKGALPTIHADAHMLQAGVTTAVDVGTVGWRHFPMFKETVVDTSTVRILALLNIASGGMVDSATEQTASEFHPKIVASVIEQYPDVLLGVKTAHYWGRHPFDADHPSWGSMDKSLEAAALCGKPLMVDFQPNRDCDNSYPNMLKKLRPGDIHTHVFAQQFPIVDKAGKVYDHMWEARERGVYFDLGHGAGSFWFRNAVPAFKDGFTVDTISTDLHFANIKGVVLSMLNVMSKMMNVGMPLYDVIRRSTCEPAKLINRPDLGTLSVGACADVAVLRKLEGEYNYIDCGKARLNGTSKLKCMMTYRAGNLVYDFSGMSLPDWEHAPESYWHCPSLFL